MIGDFIPSLGFLDRIMNYKAAMQRTHGRYDSFLNRVLQEHRQHQQQSNGTCERDLVDILLSLPGEDGAEPLDGQIIKGLLMIKFLSWPYMIPQRASYQTCATCDITKHLQAHTDLSVNIIDQLVGLFTD